MAQHILVCRNCHLSAPEVDGCVITCRPAERKRALLASNPPRNSRPETHRDKADADESRSSALLLIARAAVVDACIYHGRFPHALKIHC